LEVKFNYVVYEGEMQNGMRDGRGICLYNNNNLYEGEWKKNREHGIGTLMTSDRKRIIYEGAWEKGRMHGHGAYYYYSDVLGGGRGGVVVVVEGVSVVRVHWPIPPKFAKWTGREHFAQQ
jgi:hypothetical protein